MLLIEIKVVTLHAEAKGTTSELDRPKGDCRYNMISIHIKSPYIVCYTNANPG